MNNHQKAGHALKATLLARDPDFYRKIGRMGGLSEKKPGGFATMDKDRLREVASLGGRNRIARMKQRKTSV